MKNLIIFILTACTLSLQAQTYPLQVTIQIAPPYTPSLITGMPNPNQITMTIINSSSETKQVYFAGYIHSMDESIRLTVDGSQPWNAPPMSIPPGASTYNALDLQPFLHNPNVSYYGISENDIRMNQVPEKEYQVCIRAYDYNDFAHPPLSADGFAGGCSNVFPVRYPPPPQLIAPACGGFVTSYDPQNIVFNWQLPTGNPQGAVVRYEFKIVLLTEGIDAQSALQASTNPVYTYETPVTSLNYGLAEPPLIEGQEYAWQVRVFDVAGNILFQNNGYSEPCTFIYSSSEAGGVFSLVYPRVNDTIPWANGHFPIIHRFDPYSNSYVKYKHDFQIYSGGVLRDTYSTENTWPNGPRRGQESVLGYAPGTFSDLQAQHLPLYKIPGAIEFTRGVTFNFEAEAHIAKNPTFMPDQSGNIQGRFTTGMGKPQLNSPENNAVVEAGTVSLEFKTANSPSLISPPFEVMQTQGNSGFSIYGSMAFERWVLELSKKDDFSTILNRFTETVGPFDMWGNCDEGCLTAALYKDVVKSVEVPDTGWYYWRVKWLSNPNDENSSPYLTSSVSKFHIGELDQETAPAETATAPGECVDNCAAPIIPAELRVPSTSATVGSVVKIGLFDMTITQLTWGGNTATGKGTVNVPLMHAPLKVSFTGIKINSENKVYDGEVNSEYDNAEIVSEFIPTSFLSTGGSLAGMSQEQTQSLSEYINSGSRLVSQFTGSTPIGMPIGIDRTIDGQRYIIGIVNANFTTSKATMNAMMSFDIPDIHGTISLGAKDICFHPNGFGGDGKVTLYLPNDLDIPLGGSGGGEHIFDNTLRFKGTHFNSDYTTVSDSGTYVTWDCQGFKSLLVKGEVLFSQNALVEDLANGNQGTEQIKAEFKISVKQKGNWMARLNFNKPFQLKDAKGWGFRVNEAWLDFSLEENAIGFTLPEHYAQLADIPANDEFLFAGWQGFYLKDLSLLFPQGIFKNASHPTQRLTASFQNVLIDKRAGFSAGIRLRNILSINEGMLHTWGFSLDSAFIDITASSFVQAGLGGKIILPLDANTQINYRALLSQNPATNDVSFSLQALPSGQINVSAWIAKITLAQNSYIAATVDGNGVFAEAQLNGNIKIQGNAPVIGAVNFGDMHFQNLKIQSRNPFISCGNCTDFSFNSPQKFMGGDFDPEPNPDPMAPSPDNEGSGDAGGFPLSITNIQFVNRNTNLFGFSFDLGLNICESANAFEAKTTIALLGKVDISSGIGKQTFSFHGVEFDSVGIGGTVGPVTLNGGLKFYNSDATYGNGMKGVIRARFEPGIDITVAAQFGKKGSGSSAYRYWYADAMALFTPGLPVCTGLEIYGFGGGAWYNMQQGTNLPDYNAIANADTTGGRTIPGKTLSNATYTPSRGHHGFKARVAFGNNGGGQTYNGNVELGANFTSSSGIENIYLKGAVYVMVERNNQTSAQIYGTADISYNFPNRTFDGIFDIGVNAVGGKIRGINADNKAGTILMHFGPDTWHVLIGTPDAPLGLKFLFPMLSADFSAYFMTGLNLPGPKDPPDNVLRCIDNFDSRIVVGDIPNGDGFAFGARFNYRQRYEFLAFYAYFGFGAGFDLALKKYPNVYCNGNPPYQLGLNGWYADGQLWAYVEAGVGIHVDLWIVEGDFSLFDFGAAVWLRAAFPNPSFFKGAIGGHYSILGGMVKGNCNFQFQAGERCEILTDPLGGIDIVSSIAPANGAQNVDCGVYPMAAFNLEINKPFDVRMKRNQNNDEDTVTIVRTFQFILDGFELKKNGNMVAASNNIATDKFSMEMIPVEMLDPNQEYKLKLKISGQERVNGSWRQSYRANNTAIKLDTTITFRTGGYPTKINDRDVQYTRPLKGQRFYLQNECKKGLIILKQGMTRLFEPQPEDFTNGCNRRKFEIRFMPIEGGEVIKRDIVYGTDPLGNFRVAFDMPTLSNNTVYAAQLVFKDSRGGSSGTGGLSLPGGTNTNPVASSITNSISGTTFNFNQYLLGNIEIRQTRRDARTALGIGEKLAYLFFFKTSQFNTLNEKVNQLQPTSVREEAWSDLVFLFPSYTSTEGFDKYDVYGSRYDSRTLRNVKIGPLVGLLNPMADQWAEGFVRPIVYNTLSHLRSVNLTSVRLNRVSPDTVGIPPARSVFWSDDFSVYQPLSETETFPLSNPNSTFNIGTSGGIIKPPSTLLVSNTYKKPGFKFHTGMYVYLDYTRVQQAVNGVIAIYGDPRTSEFYTQPTRTVMTNFVNTRYKKPFKERLNAKPPLISTNGEYRINFTYYDPYLYCTQGTSSNYRTFKYK